MITPGLAILVKRFPKLSETFIAGELTELVRQEIPFRIFSMYRPKEPVKQRQRAELQSLVTYFDEVSELDRTKMVNQPEMCERIRALNLSVTPGANTTTTEELTSLLALIDRFNVRHLHVHCLNSPTALADFASQISRVTFSVSAHAKDIYLTPKEDIILRLEGAQFVATCTSHNAKYLQSISPENSSSVYQIYHGIDTEYFSPVQLTAAEADGDYQERREPKILSIGRFRRKKGFDLLIQACSRLRASGVTFHAQIVGYGEEAESLARQIDSYQLAPIVELCSPVDHDGVRELMRQATLFVMPCRIDANGDRDGIPNVLLEAMAIELPVIATAISGIPEVIHTELNGLLVPPEDPEALSKQIQRLLANQVFAIELGQRGRKSVCAMFNWKANVSTLAGLLRQAVEPVHRALV